MKNTNTANPTASTWEALCKAVESNPTDPAAIMPWAEAVARSVLRKVADPQRKARNDDPNTPTDSGCNPYIEAMRRDLGGDLAALQHGNTARIITEAADLANEAAAALLEEYRKATESGRDFGLWKPYDVRRLSRRVWIKTEDSANGWKTESTTPAAEVFRAVRRAIAASRAVQADPRSGYAYIDAMATDPESGEAVELYRRLPKWADLGGYAVDANGPTDIYTADEAAAAAYDDVIARLGLTARRAEVLSLRLRGYGYKAIGTALGIRSDSVRDCCRAIAAAATRAGLAPTPRLAARLAADRAMD